MKWTIIVLVMLSIVGSMMWMMPSPRQRAQAILRQHAMRSGLQVQMAKLLFPRAIGEAAPDERHCIAYRLARANARVSGGYTPWQVFRLHAHATTGLPPGWCWSKGEGYLSEAQLAQLAEVITALPDDVYSLESTPVAVSAYWYENGSQETVDGLKATLQRLLDQGL